MFSNIFHYTTFPQSLNQHAVVGVLELAFKAWNSELLSSSLLFIHSDFNLYKVKIVYNRHINTAHASF